MEFKNVEQWDDVITQAKLYLENMENYSSSLKLMIDKFQQEEIVQSLEIASTFGAEELGKLKLLSEKVDQFVNEIIEPQVTKTVSYAQNQKELLVNGSKESV